MNIRRMTATYGRLDRHTLLLSEGLNLIHAPNESGKSTWSAFLRTMLYGLATRDRGPLADKNRYAPWSGAAMEGILELESAGREITLIRQTSRRNSPMGAFSALYTGTAAPVSGLDAAGCGEALLDVPREVYERTAFIGQAGVAIDQVGSLERRIAALIATGEEDASYTEAADRLKKQLTRRRYHRNGILPALEAELAEIAAQQREANALRREMDALEAELPLLEQQAEQCARALADCRRLAALEGRRAYFHLLEQLEEARAELSRREAEAAGLPGKTGLIGLKSAAGNVVVNQMSKKRAEEQLAQRSRETAEALEKLEDFPLFHSLTGQTALERAEADRMEWLRLRGRARLGQRLTLAAAVTAAILGILLGCGILPPWPGATALIAPAALLIAGVALAGSSKTAKALAEAYHAGDEAGFSAYAQQYYTLYSIYIEQQQNEAESRTRVDALTTGIDSSAEQILAGVRVFSPEVTDLTSAAAAIDRAMARLDRLEEARQSWDQLRIRCETLESTLTDTAPLTPEELALEPPAQSPEQLQEALEQTRAALENHRRQLALLQGQLKAAGDSTELEARRQELETRRQTTEAEYTAIAAAMAALENANTDLQNRFSPALGAEAAEIFSRLTGGRYHKVLLDRELNAQAETTEDPIPRAAPLLSRGTADQLYLAVRLALCRLVLSRDDPPPLVLDDALSNFDDRRMALALDVLREEAKTRQILLFTCQERELGWAEGKEDVHIIRLTDNT